jgi:two-component system OmpR family response regulator
LQLRILVVDDDEQCLDSVESVLVRDGHQIFTATRGLEALEFARRFREDYQRLDLSILDFNMPDLTGIQTFQLLVEEYPALHGIFISGEVSETLERSIRLAGGSALVRKPLDIGRLRHVVGESVGSDGCEGRGGVN